MVARSLAIEEMRPVLPRFLGLELVYLVLYTILLFWGSKLPTWLLHVYLVVQCLLVLWMLSLRPQFDFVILLFLLLTFQVALNFSGWTRWLWVGILVTLSGGSLIYHLGLLQGLAKSLTTIAGEIVLVTYIIAAQEVRRTQNRSEELLNELQDTHQRLQQYAAQAEELASIQERNNLARALHDTVSQVLFGISLTTRSAQLLMESNPGRVPEILGRLQGMSSDALSQLRLFIAQLRPPQSS